MNDRKNLPLFDFFDVVQVTDTGESLREVTLLRVPFSPQPEPTLVIDPKICGRAFVSDRAAIGQVDLVQFEADFFFV